MKVNIEQSWNELLLQEFDKPYFVSLTKFVKEEYKTHAIYPPGPKMFNAFEKCPFDKLEVVILGQDPYHGLGQANGLCFSVNDGVPIPPSLRNIFKEIKDDIGKEIPTSGNLERWAKQGVLLLNATLTVRQNEPGSHQNKGWEIFTDEVIKIIAEKKRDVVFILWGSYAQKKGEFLTDKKHLILKAAHPSPFAAHRGFFGCRHFSKANDYLLKNNKRAIDW